MRLFLTLVLTLLLAFSNTYGQRNCGTMEVLDKQLQENPSMLKNMEEIEKQVQEYLRAHPHGSGERVVITIPTVFHVVYRTTTENISDAQIMSQLDVLNKDFSATNSDVGLTPSLFSGLVANAEIQFCLAKQTPSGGTTSGITRKSTTVSAWGTNDSVKKSSQGGVDPWDASKYLNIWICNIGGGILGYAQFPGGSASTDGVVLDYRYTGTTGTATAPFNKGRTGTHEVGHWLNLRHIWGDATCGSDLVSDTPVHNTSNYGCPTYPHYSTCTGSPVEMTMNYMDYTDDACMYMFSAGQKTRMRAVLEGSGARASLASSPGCTAPSGGGTCAAPTGLVASNVTASAATCSWAAVTGASSYRFEYKTNAATTWSTFTTTSTSVNLTGLSASTTYNTRVLATCSSGNSAYSSTVNFTTLAAGGCTDSFESNNSQTAAKAITPGTAINALIGTSTDVDWFKFSNSSTKKNIKVNMTNLPADYDMILYRSSTQVGISENEGTLDEQIIYNTSTSATTYYVKVYGYNGAFNTSICYNLLAQISSSSYFRTSGEEIDIETTPVTGELLVFPNPATNEISLVLPFGKGGEGTLSILDVTGKMMFSQKMTAGQADKTYNMDVSGFKPGLYLVYFSTGQQTFTQKLAVSQDR